ncbi:MAG: hypothetical protein H6Q05_1785, partial [Acidobacteria bacterium]|nr:hypothetical protein [Acidobacteriota bacterium]
MREIVRQKANYCMRERYRFPQS